ncbi:hypothetical protein HDV00_007729 [Rhizophlyctis rosea]|nr:hypothetical protein HDV00_007729 [Rhizophlyctis rosea]
MLIGHYIPAFLIRPFTNVSLPLLALGAILPDALFFTLAFFKIERFPIDPAAVGAFKYRPVYPYSHSLAGMAAMGAVLGVLQFAGTKRWKEALVLGMMPLTHFVLELPGHRGDIVLFPTLQSKIHQFEQSALGLGLFDNPHITFAIEAIPIILTTLYYAAFLPRHKLLSTIMLLFTLIPQQVLFAYGDLPTWNSEQVHGPMLILTSLATLWVMRVVDSELVAWERSQGRARGGVVAEKYVMKSSVDDLTRTVKGNLGVGQGVTGGVAGAFRSVVGKTETGAEKTKLAYAGDGKWKVMKGWEVPADQVREGAENVIASAH